jgi:hypothetical protein
MSYVSQPPVVTVINMVTEMVNGLKERLDAVEKMLVETRAAVDGYIKSKKKENSSGGSSSGEGEGEGEPADGGG